MNKNIIQQRDMIVRAGNTICFKSVAPQLRAAGLRTQDILDGSSETHLAECPAASYLVNSRLRRNDRQSERSVQNYFTDGGLTTLALSSLDETRSTMQALPASRQLDAPLGHAIAGRRSGRDYNGASLPLADLATILRAGAGKSDTMTVPLSNGDTVEYVLRTVSSGGGLYPVQVYPLILNVDGLPRGLYRYSVARDALQPRKDEGVVEPLLGGFAVPDAIIPLRQAAAIIMFVAQPQRSVRKYGARGLRFVLFEAGAMAQTMHLASGTLGHLSVDCASFYEDEMHPHLDVDGVSETLIHTVVIGCTDEK